MMTSLPARVSKCSLFVRPFICQLLQLNSSHAAELDAARTTHGELQDRLRSATSEVLQLRSSVMQVSAERDKLREQCRCHIRAKEGAFKPAESFSVHFRLLFVYISAKWDRRLKHNQQHCTASGITSASSPQRDKRRSN